MKCIHNFGAITSKEKATYNTYVVFRWEDNIKINFKDVGCVGVGWICRDRGADCCEHDSGPLSCVKCMKIPRLGEKL